MALLYYAAARFGLLLAFQKTNASPVWPPSGIALAALLLLGYRAWPGIALGAFLANATVFFSNQVAHPLLITTVSGAIAAGNTFEALAGRWLLERLGALNFMERTKDNLRFVAVALVMCLASSTLGPLSMALGGIIPWSLFKTVWLTWWIGDVTGVLVVTPLLLTWWESRRFAAQPARWRSEVALFYLILWVVSQQVFGSPVSANPILHRVYIPFPILLWGAIRFRSREVATGLGLVSAVAVAGTLRGLGPLAAASLNESLLVLQVFLCVTVLTISTLSAALAERRLAEQKVKKMNETLEQQVEERTVQLEAANRELREEVHQRRRLEGDILRVGETEKRWLGETLHDDLSQQLLGTALISKLLEQRLAEKSPEEAEQAGRITQLIHQLMARVREVARGLYPVEVKAESLLPALSRLASTAMGLGKVLCEFSCNSVPDLQDDDVATQLYHVAQEAVSNALKHSGARRITLCLLRSPSELTLVVEDDGVGLNEAVRRSTGLGRTIMAHRAGRIGARLEVSARPGGGTRVSCSLPMPSYAPALEPAS